MPIIKYIDEILATNKVARNKADKLHPSSSSTIANRNINDNTTTTRLFSFLDNNNSNNINVNRVNVLDDRIKNFMPESVGKWKKFDEVKKIRSGEVSSGHGESNAWSRYTKPYYKYNKIIKNADRKAIEFGFRNEADLAKKIEDAAKMCETINGRRLVNGDPTWRNLWLRLRKIKHKGKKLIAATATGTAAALVVYLAKEQRKNTGCFRYKLAEKKKGSNGSVAITRYKVAGNFCISNDDYDYEYNEDKIDDDDDNVKIIPPENHPLFNHEKWDCDYDDFYMNGNELDRERIDEIRQLGCNGLCDVLNYNMLTSFTNDEYQPLSPPSEEEKGDEVRFDDDDVDVDSTKQKNDNEDDSSIISEEKKNNNNQEYMYVCERATFLRTLIDQSLEVVEDILDDVLLTSPFVEKLIQMLYKFVFIVIILYIGFYLITSRTIPFFTSTKEGNYYNNYHHHHHTNPV